jgi:hypothetical protein
MLWLIFKNEEVWWPPLDFMFYGFKDAYLEDPGSDDWDSFKDVHKQSWFRQYLVALYTSALQFSLVEICPRTSFEIFSVVVFMVFSSIYNAFLFGEFAVLMSQLGASDETF